MHIYERQVNSSLRFAGYVSRLIYSYVIFKAVLGTVSTEFCAIINLEPHSSIVICQFEVIL
jgi:hypothetical protein